MCKKFSRLCVLGFVKPTEILIDSEDEYGVRAVHFYN